MRFYFYHIRKHLVHRLAVEHGINVLQTDADVAWFDNPYPKLKSHYRHAHLVTQHDTPYINAGVFYVQVRPISRVRPNPRRESRPNIISHRTTHANQKPALAGTAVL